MANYNIIDQTGIYTNTASGTGNISFTGAQLAVLYDGNTTTSGITISGPDTIYLECDFYYRVKIDGIRVYINSATASGTVAGALTIGYRTTNSGSYTVSGTGIGPGYYYADNLPAFFAPSNIRIIITGVECEICEVITYNSDEIVDFGSDGLLTEQEVEAYEGIDTSVAIPIYNDGELGTDPINAYVSLDYINSDPILKIGNSSDGVFYGINDAIMLDSNNSADGYFWDQGYYLNSKVEDSYVKQDLTSLTWSEITSRTTYNTDTLIWDKYYPENSYNSIVFTNIDLLKYNSFFKKAWYFETTVVTGTRMLVGISRSGQSMSEYIGDYIYGYGYYSNTGQIY